MPSLHNIHTHRCSYAAFMLFDVTALVFNTKVTNALESPVLRSKYRTVTRCVAKLSLGNRLLICRLCCYRTIQPVK